MTQNRLKLQSFEIAEVPSPQISLDPAEFEEARLAAFEKGYTAGWDDAIAAQDSEAARLRADLGQNLRDLSFTYHDVRQHVLSALKPLLEDMAAKVLPVVARETLAPIIAEQLAPLTESLASTPITVVSNPLAMPQIREILSAETELPLVFQAEPTLGESQVYLRFTETETCIDLDGVIALIQEAIATYFNTQSKEQAHG